jgi:branched-chain amino acid transport system ATP-binding protein
MAACMTAAHAAVPTGLQVLGLVKHFDGVQAVKGVNFDVQAGECVALIGPNGAGKSTSFACIAGQHAPTAGQVLWQGQCIDGWPAQRRLKAGVARTFQVAQTYPALTVLQNVQLCMQAGQGLSAYKLLDSQWKAEAMALLDGAGLGQQAQADAMNLPYGAKKRLELAMALATRPRPGLLLLDEPAAGLAAQERQALMQSVKALASDGMAVLYTEHNMDAVFGVADRVIVLIDGLIAAQGRADDVARDATVQRLYLGKSLAGVVHG